METEKAITSSLQGGVSLLLHVYHFVDILRKYVHLHAPALTIYTHERGRKVPAAFCRGSKSENECRTLSAEKGMYCTNNSSSLLRSHPLIR